MFATKPNPRLRDSFLRLNLCTEADFRRCRRRVRKLACGLPVFDFVWIDALVQLGRLTPFQAKVLESSPPAALCAGPCLLLDCLGRGESSETYMARTVSSAETVVLKRLRLPADSMAELETRLRRDIDNLRGLACPYVVAPHWLEEHDGALLLVSRYVNGIHCRDLLVRRGRFPPSIVMEIARQLAEGLAALESRGCLHGEIRLSNVRINSQGQAVLVDAAVSRALGQGVFIRDDVAPESYDGIAPELIGTGEVPNTASQMYAFGCLLWCLLAGRAPFPTADPLGKLAAHQSRPVPDVREFAPDTPNPLAEAIRAFTQRDPRMRPTTFADVAAKFGRATKTGERKLAGFRRRFQTAAPAETSPPERNARFPMAAALAILFVISGAALVLLDAGASTEILRLGSGVSASLSRATSRNGPVDPKGPPASRPAAARERQRSIDGLQPLPAPNSEGLILLDHGPYEAETVTCVGDLRILGVGRTAPTIVVRNRPFKIACRKFVLEHVGIRHEIWPPDESAGSRNPDPPAALLMIGSQELAIEGCTFAATAWPGNGVDRIHQSMGLPEPSADALAAIVWTTESSPDPDAGHLRLKNVLFLNKGAGVAFLGPPGRIEADNCLKIGGALFDIRDWPAGRDFSIVARRVTLREAESFCWGNIPNGTRRSGQLRATVEDSVFDLAGPRAGLVRFAGNSASWRSQVPLLITGSESVIRTDIPIVSLLKAGSPRALPADVRDMAVEGLAAGEFRFLGPVGPSPKDSAVDRQSLQIPRRSEEPPGILADVLAARVGQASESSGAPRPR